MCKGIEVCDHSLATRFTRDSLRSSHFQTRSLLLPTPILAMERLYGVRMHNFKREMWDKHIQC